MQKIYGSKMQGGELVHYEDKVGTVMGERAGNYLVYFDDTKAWVPASLCYYIKDKEYKSQAARDAQSSGYGKEGYWDYLDRSAQEHYNYFMLLGNVEKANLMFTQSLSESLRGNEGA